MFLDFGLSNGIGVSEVAHGFGVVADDRVAGVGVMAVALMLAESRIISLDVFKIRCWMSVSSKPRKGVFEFDYQIHLSSFDV